MTKAELLELMGTGENSSVVFCRDGGQPVQMAQRMAALLNLRGGHILLGVESGGTVSGLTREPKATAEWAFDLACDRVRPAPMPFWQHFEWENGKTIGVVSLPANAPDKPYKAKRGSAWVTMIRTGTTIRDASDEEEIRLYQQSGRLRYDIKPVPGTGKGDLDSRRLAAYFRDMRQQRCPEEGDDEGWTQLLLNTDLAIEDRGRVIPTVAAVLMFGKLPNRHLPQAGITAVAYRGLEKDYEATARTQIRGPAVALRSRDGELVETGVIEQAIDFVRRNVGAEAWLEDGAVRRQRWDYPLEAVREAVVNAIAHRDYAITVTDIEMSIYADRLEVVSPGRLPNTVTVAKMKAGYRASRNELVKEILRDYSYVEATGLGVPRKIVFGMRQHNGTEPDLIEEEDRLIVRLWKNARP